jgi:hypothetical protein
MDSYCSAGHAVVEGSRTSLPLTTLCPGWMNAAFLLGPNRVPRDLVHAVRFHSAGFHSRFALRVGR